MSRSALRLLAVLAAVVALWAAWSWYASDARRIRRQLSTLQELVGKTPLENEIQGLGKARKAAELFAERFEFRAPQFDFATRDRGRLISAIHQYRSRSDTIAMRIFDHDLVLDAAAERATSVFTAEFITGVRGTLGREGYRFQLNWLRTGGGWRIDYVELLEILEEPASASASDLSRSMVAPTAGYCVSLSRSICSLRARFCCWSAAVVILCKTRTRANTDGTPRITKPSLRSSIQG